VVTDEVPLDSPPVEPPEVELDSPAPLEPPVLPDSLELLPLLDSPLFEEPDELDDDSPAVDELEPVVPLVLDCGFVAPVVLDCDFVAPLVLDCDFVAPVALDPEVPDVVELLVDVVACLREEASRAGSSPAASRT
jgi:hypothetical protein